MLAAPRSVLRTLGLASPLARRVARLGVLPRREFRHGLPVRWPSFCPAGRRWSALLARSKPKKKSFCGAVRGLLSHRPCYPGSPPYAASFARPRASPWSRSAGNPARPQAAAAWRHRVGQTRRWVQTPNPLRGICARDEACDFKAQHVRAPKGVVVPEGRAEDGTNQHGPLIYSLLKRKGGGAVYRGVHWMQACSRIATAASRGDTK